MLMGMLFGDLSQDVRGGEAAAIAPSLVSEERGATAALRECKEIEIEVHGSSSQGHVVG